MPPCGCLFLRNRLPIIDSICLMIKIIYKWIKSHPSSAATSQFGECLPHAIFFCEKGIPDARGRDGKSLKFQVRDNSRIQARISKHFLHGEVILGGQELLDLLLQTICEPGIILHLNFKNLKSAQFIVIHLLLVTSSWWRISATVFEIFSRSLISSSRSFLYCNSSWQINGLIWSTQVSNSHPFTWYE